MKHSEEHAILLIRLNWYITVLESKLFGYKNSINKKVKNLKKLFSKL